MKKYGDGEPERPDERAVFARGREEVADLREVAGEVPNRGSKTHEPTEVGVLEADDPETVTGGDTKAPSEALEGLSVPATDNDDVRRADLEEKPLQTPGRGMAVEFPDPPYLPGVEGGVGDRGPRRVDEEDAGVTSGWVWKEGHRSVETDGERGL